MQEPRKTGTPQYVAHTMAYTGQSQLSSEQKTAEKSKFS